MVLDAWVFLSDIGEHITTITFTKTITLTRFEVVMLNSRLEGAILEFLGSENLLEPRKSSGNTNLPLVTVGVCAKNAEKTIVDCLDSIVRSNYDKSKLRIILVDGKSLDATLAISAEILEKSGCTFEILSDSGKGLGFA